MKQLTHEVFKYYPSWIQTFVVCSTGDLFGYRCKKDELEIYKDSLWIVSDKARSKESCFLATGYDATDWQNSAISREY